MEDAITPVIQELISETVKKHLFDISNNIQLDHIVENASVNTSLTTTMDSESINEQEETVIDIHSEVVVKEAEAHVMNTAEPGVVEEAVEPAVVEEAVEPAVVEEAAEPAVVEEAVEPAVVEEAVEPAVVEKTVEPAVVEEAVEPAVVEKTVEPVAVENIKLSLQDSKIEHMQKQLEILQKELYEQKERESQENRVREEFRMRRAREMERMKIDQEAKKREKQKEAQNMGFEVIEKNEKKENKKGRVPDILIVVPYRDREPQRSAFMKIMPHILEDKNCRVIFVHQRDKRPFNRGAMKNIGFLWAKMTYPHHYRNITLVFHDIDNMPWHKQQFSYQTRHGWVNHFYGYERALGGIFAIKGADFEQINGFPNIWTWGLEDNILNLRVMKNKKKIMRPQFVSVEKDNSKIIGLWHGWDRLISPNIENKMRYDKGVDGIMSLRKVRFGTTDMDSLFSEVNVVSFTTGESLSSPFVRHAKMRNARQNAHQNKRFYIRGPKRGSAGTFGRKRGFGGMAM